MTRFRWDDMADGLPELPAPKVRNGSRAKGTNPRAKRTNPRAKGTNPTAGLASDVARVGRMIRHALARYYVTTERRWCERCDDTGWVPTHEGSRTVEPCGPLHREMTTAEAYELLHPDM